jgi:hypothetical protein
MSTANPNTCYVLMPFSTTASHSQDEWTEIYDNFLKPTIESHGFSCARSQASVGMILKGIIDSIHTSNLILADLTDSNPNVFYELGIAHTITNRVVMITQNVSSVPSDLKPYGVIVYDPKTQRGAVNFGKDLSEAIRKMNTNLTHAASPVFEFTKRTLKMLEPFYGPAVHPIALMQCAKCGRRYEVPINGMTHGSAVRNEGNHLCGHWEPAIFLGIKGVQSFAPSGYAPL